MNSIQLPASMRTDFQVIYTAQLLAAVHANRWNRLILNRLPALQLPDCWLTAGCIAQTVWNVQAGRAPEDGIADYDVFYFDEDVSWEAEDAVIHRVGQHFADLPITIQVRNQARVPLWYRNKFGIDYGTVTQACDGIRRFPCASTAVGVRVDRAIPAVFAPFGLQNLFDGVLIPNPALPIRVIYETKAARWQSVWPHLRIQAWSDQVSTRPPHTDACNPHDTLHG